MSLLSATRDLDEVPLESRPAHGTILNLLLLCDDRYPAGTTRSHITALRRYSRHRIFSFNPLVDDAAILDALEAFDALVVHYSILVISEVHLPAPVREKVARFGGLKLQFIQDEYRRVDEVTGAIRQLGIDVLFSSLRPDNASRVYGRRLPDAAVISNMPGYVSQTLADRATRPLSQRPLHTTYRSRELPYWLGRHARLKHDLAVNFPSFAKSANLRFDVSAKEADRRYGGGWLRLLTSGKTTLGTEGGASIFDFTGEIERQTARYIGQNPGADFEKVHEAVLAPHEGNVVHKVLTPRIFEAIALRTALVLCPGEYCGVIQPWRHYVPLNPDFSNWDDVVRALRDDHLLAGVAENAYREVIQAGRYSERAFVSRFDCLVAAAFAARRPASVVGGQARFARFRIPAATRRAFARLRRAIRSGYWWARLRIPFKSRMRAAWDAWRGAVR